jgi:hypothetical protein
MRQRKPEGFRNAHAASGQEQNGDMDGIPGQKMVRVFGYGILDMNHHLVDLFRTEDKGYKGILGIRGYIGQRIVTDDLKSGKVIQKSAHSQKHGIEGIGPVLVSQSDTQEKRWR